MDDRVSDSRRKPIRLVRAFARALRERATYDVRYNPGLWLGLVSAMPIPVLVIIAAAPSWVILASFVSSIAWSVIVGAVVRVGILGMVVIQDMTADALDRTRSHEATCDDLRDTIAVERSAHERLARLQQAAYDDLALGQIIQQSLVPEDIRSGDVEVVLRHLPCALVGGDYLQAVLLDSNVLYLCVGDVAGHGVAAALIVSRIHGLVQSMIRDDIRPHPFLESLNRATLQLVPRTSLFVTFAVLRIDLSTRMIEYATAGHPPQLLLRSHGGVEELATPGIALGVLPTVFGRGGGSGCTDYAPGDTLLLFTDGVFEVRAVDGRIWGEESLRSRFARMRGATPGAMAADVLREAARFHGLGAFDDDVSVMVARLGIASTPFAPREDSHEVRSGL